MKCLPAILLLTLLPAFLAQAANGNGNAKNRTRGNPNGTYSLTVAGNYTGTGSANKQGVNVDINNLTLTASDGSSVTVSFKNIKTNKDRFSATSNGWTIEGRLDLPAANDDETTDAQAITGRITATLTDPNGKTARLVGIQDNPAPASGPANASKPLAPKP